MAPTATGTFFLRDGWNFGIVNGARRFLSVGERR